MSVRTKLLSWRNINTDSDFSKYIETVSEPWVIEWMAVSSNSVATWKCWCPCERTNWETIYALVEAFTATTIDTSWTGYVVVTIPQNAIDDGSIINEDGTNVASIEVVSELPTKNYLLLATLTSGSITDSRNMIKKVWELNTAIESLTSYVTDIDDRVKELEAAWAIDHLEEQALVWELYTTSNTLFRQQTPTLANSTVEDCHVWDTAANTEIHIQRIASWVEWNTLKLKSKMVGSPTTNMKVEVREWVQVTVTANSEAYWYWDESKVLATWTLAYTNFSTSWAEVTFTLDNAISVDEWTLLDIVVYQESWWTKVVNASNYYILACDSTQWSEAFSFVSVNGSTRTRSKLMPYCISSCFAQSLLCKPWSSIKLRENCALNKTSNSGSSSFTDDIYTITTTWSYNFSCNLSHSSQNASSCTFNLKNKWSDTNLYSLSYMWSKQVNTDLSLTSWNTLQIDFRVPSWTSWGYSNAVLKRARNVIPKDNWRHKMKPITAKWIWNLINVISYGRLPNWDWWTWN